MLWLAHGGSGRRAASGGVPGDASRVVGLQATATRAAGLWVMATVTRQGSGRAERQAGAGEGEAGGGVPGARKRRGGERGGRRGGAPSAQRRRAGRREAGGALGSREGERRRERDGGRLGLHGSHGQYSLHESQTLEDRWACVLPEDG